MKRLLLLAIIASAIVAPSAQAPAQADLDAAIASIDATMWMPVRSPPARSSNS